MITTKKTSQNGSTATVLFFIKLLLLISIAVRILLYFLGYTGFQDTYYEGIFSIALAIILFIGLQKRKSWVIVLAILYGAFSLLTALLSLNIILIIAYLLWLYFFTKKSTKAYFGDQGTRLL
ncbi:MAG: hypothetical protein AAB553_08210 [Patescibacteria group bacterium]